MLMTLPDLSSSPASCSRYWPQMRSNCNLLRIPSAPVQPVPRRHSVSTLTVRLSTTSFFTHLHPSGVIVSGRGFEPAHIGTATETVRENACSARVLLRGGAAVHSSRLKIATNVKETAQVCSDGP